MNRDLKLDIIKRMREHAALASPQYSATRPGRRQRTELPPIMVGRIISRIIISVLMILLIPAMSVVARDPSLHATLGTSGDCIVGQPCVVTIKSDALAALDDPLSSRVSTYIGITKPSAATVVYSSGPHAVTSTDSEQSFSLQSELSTGQCASLWVQVEFVPTQAVTNLGYWSVASDTGGSSSGILVAARWALYLPRVQVR